jgi:hypothetical protein
MKSRHSASLHCINGKLLFSYFHLKKENEFLFSYSSSQANVKFVVGNVPECGKHTIQLRIIRERNSTHRRGSIPQSLQRSVLTLGLSPRVLLKR